MLSTSIAIDSYNYRPTGHPLCARWKLSPGLNHASAWIHMWQQSWESLSGADSLSTGHVIHTRLVCKHGIRLVYMKMVHVPKFRINEQLFSVVSQTPLLSGPRVVKSVYRERHIGLPAGFVWPNRYVIYDVVLYVFTVLYDVYNSWCPKFVWFHTHSPHCVPSRKSVYRHICSDRLRIRHLIYKQQTSFEQIPAPNVTENANFSKMFSGGEWHTKIEITYQMLSRIASGFRGTY